MLIVKVELHSAITGQVTELARMKIYNTGKGTKATGDYGCERLREDRIDGKFVPARKGGVTRYPRLALSVWNLVEAACVATRKRETVDFKEWAKEERDE